MSTEAAEEEIRRRCDGGDSRAAVKAVFQDPDKRLDRRDVERTAWIVTVPFYGKPYIDDAKYLYGDRTTETMQISRPRQNNIPLVQMLCTRNQSELSLYSLMEIKTLSRIDKIRSSSIATVVHMHFQMSWVVVKIGKHF